VVAPSLISGGLVGLQRGGESQRECVSERVSECVSVKLSWLEGHNSSYSVCTCFLVQFADMVRG
jgi:hypothetical protein